MPQTCCVPGCKSNYNNSTGRAGNDYVSVFRFPKDTELRNKWTKCIPRKDWSPTVKSVVCKKHFQESDIIISDTFTDKAGIVHVIPRGRPSLKPDACPTIFPELRTRNPSVQVTKSKSRKVPLERENDILKNHEENNITKTEDMIPSFNIKQEPDYETDRNMETQSFITSESIKQEPEYEATSDNEITDQDVKVKQEEQDSDDTLDADTNAPFCHDNVKQELEDDYDYGDTVKTEASGDEECEMSPIMARSDSKFISDEDNSLYCEVCQMKYEGGCPEHGHIIYIEKAESGEDYSHYSSSRFEEAENKDKQVSEGSKKVKQSQFYAAHNDDMKTLSSEDCNAESNEMLSECEMESEFCVTGTSNGLQNNIQIKAHQKVHNTGKPFICDVCEAEFAFCCHLKAHKKTHTTEKPYACNMCDMEFSSYEHLQSHKNTHAGEKTYKCNICGIRFAEQSGLKTHKQFHLKENPFKCLICGVIFVRKADLQVHMRTHTGEKPFSCNMCDARFTRNDHLKIHMRKHTGERPYKCEVCGAGFAESGSLLRHKRTHTGEKPYKCDVCGLQFSLSCSLTLHKRSHTGERPYKCDMCTAEFSESGSLIRHKRTHTGEKPYKCDVCGLKFPWSSSLTLHKRTHTKEKPYKCDICSAEFSGSGSLSMHKKIHTGEKPYKCDECGSRFTRSGHLKNHQKIHNRNKPLISDTLNV